MGNDPTREELARDYEIARGNAAMLKPKAVDMACQRCGHLQRVVHPWAHVPQCANCREPMLRDARTESNSQNSSQEK